jgi:hypothetical protein
MVKLLDDANNWHYDSKSKLCTNDKKYIFSFCAHSLLQKYDFYNINIVTKMIVKSS